MVTMKHPYAPTITYGCSLEQAIASYATDHLYDYEVYVIEMTESAHGLALEVFSKEAVDMGIATIH